MRESLSIALFFLALALPTGYVWGGDAPKLLRQFDFCYAGALPEVPSRPDADGPYVDLHFGGQWQCEIGTMDLPNMTPPSGALMLLAAQKRFTLYDYMQGRAIRSYDTPLPIGGAALSPDGKFAIITLCKDHSTTVKDCDCCLALYDLKSGNQVRTFQTQTLNGLYCVIMHCGFTPDGKFAYVRNDGCASLWETQTGKEVWSDLASGGSGFSAHGDYYLHLKLWSDPDGPPEAWLVELATRKKVARWNEQQLNQLQEKKRQLTCMEDWQLSLDISGDGSRIIYGFGETPARDTDPPIEQRHGYVGCYNIRTGKDQFRTDRLPKPSNYGSVPAVSVTRDGRRIVACTKDGIVLLDGDTGVELQRWHPKLRVNLNDLPSRTHYLTPYIAASFSPSEKEVIVCDFWGRVTVWGLPSEEARK
jgi:WD40 repeat protein